MKIKIVAEIGINHFGRVKILNEYLKKLDNKKIDALSIQILNKNKTKKEFKKYCLSKTEIQNFFKKAKKKFKMVGVAIHSWDDFKFLKKIKLDFIKILGSSFGDYNYLKKVKSLKTSKIFLSTGGKSITQVTNFLKIVKDNKITILFTFFNTKNFTNEIKTIEIMKKKFKNEVAYGNHYKNIFEVPKVCKYKPSEIFLYIKMNSRGKFPDNEHAVPLSKLNFLVKKING